VSKCRLCGANSLKSIALITNIPVLNSLRQTPKDALAQKRADLFLASCLNCGLVQQREALAPEELYVETINYNGNWRFQPHIPEQLALLKQFTPFHSAIEVGAGTGGFLRALKNAGMPKVVGLEANRKTTSSSTDAPDDITIVDGLLSESVCRRIVRENGRFQMLIARHVLEHLLDFEQFFHCADLILEDGGYIFIEVPDLSVGHIPPGSAFTFCFHEHLSYFTASTLSELFRRYGYTGQHLIKDYRGGGVLMLLASKNALPASSQAIIPERFDVEFGEQINNYLTEIRTLAADAKDDGFSIVLYGAGLRGLVFINTSGLAGDIVGILDDVPAKHGLYLPGCPQVITPVSDIARFKKALVFLAIQPEWEEEAIDRLLKNRRGVLTIIPILSNRSHITMQ